MTKKTLRVFARGEAKVPNYAAHAAGITSRFVGWDFDETLGHEYVDAAGENKTSGGHRKKTEPTVLEFAVGDPLFAEYVKNGRDGDLEAADEATAKLFGQTFKARPAHASTPPNALKKVGE